jgi:hypothetical protein
MLVSAAQRALGFSMELSIRWEVWEGFPFGGSTGSTFRTDLVQFLTAYALGKTLFLLLPIKFMTEQAKMFWNFLTLVGKGLAFLYRLAFMK